MPDAAPRPALTPAPSAPAPAPRDLDPGRGKRIAGLVTGGLGVALAGGGVAFGLSAAGASDRISELSRTGGPWSPEYERIEQEGRRDAKLSTIFYVAGGAAVATGVVLYILGMNDDAEARQVSVAPIGSGAGLVISWRR
jgi:hypothetical protein